MVEELFSVLALGLEISVWLFITCMVLIKRRRRSIWMRLLSLFMIVGYFEIYEVLMFYHGEKLWLYSGLTEILMLALLIVINNEGCFWRNYCILILEQGMTSLLFSIFGYASPDLNEDLTKLVSFTPVAPVRACILVFGVMSLAFILSALFLKKMFKQEYEGSGYIYKRIVFGYTFISYVSLASRWKLIDQLRKNTIAGYEVLALGIVWVVSLIMVCNYVPYVYNKLDIVWRKREQETLQKLQAESQMHYAALAKQPFVYGQNLSGNVTLDAVVADYAKRAQARALLFEAVVEPLQCTDKAELDVTVIVDAMLETAFAGVVEEADAFVQLTVSERKGSLFLDVDYVTGKRVPHKKEQALADALIGKYDGSKQLRKKEENGRSVCCFRSLRFAAEREIRRNGTIITMKIIICDDERMDAERAKTILLSCKGVQEEDITILTPQEMHLGLEVQDIKCDIAIMDIEYENRQFNGITLSKELNKKLPLCQIIYLTWVLEFAPEVYDTIHCYFVLKQNEEKMLPRAMEKAIQIYCDQEDHEIIELRNHGKMMYIRQADIIYAERQDRIVQIHTAQGTYQCYQSLTKIMKLLGRNFLRCHGGYVVNYNYIDTVMRESVILSMVRRFRLDGHTGHHFMNSTCVW